MELRLTPTVIVPKGQLQPRKGALAVCKEGYVGVILGVKEKDGKETWFGQRVFTITGGSVNIAWQSVDPHVIGYITEGLFV